LGLEISTTDFVIGSSVINFSPMVRYRVFFIPIFL